MVYRTEESAIARICELRKVGLWPGYYRVRGGWALSYDPPGAVYGLDAHGYLSLGADLMSDG